MEETCKKWGIVNSETFAGMTLMRPYSKQKLVTKKIEKKGKVAPTQICLRRSSK